MDETPMLCGSGQRLGARGGLRRPDDQSGRHERCRDDAHREHDCDAEKIHVSDSGIPSGQRPRQAGAAEISW